MKKIILISTILISIFSIGLLYNKQNIKEEIVVSKKEEDNMGLPLALMVETNMDTNEYVPWKSDDWPGVGYTFNENKSRCENGGKLSWDSKTNTVLLRSKSSDKCYIYFDSPLKIYTIEDLVAFSSSVNAGTTYANEYVLLMNSLDFKDASDYASKTINQDLISGAGFTPIGDNVHPFQGTFEGNNKRIENLNIVGTGDTPAFFGTVQNAYIKNLTVSGSVSTEKELPLGGIIGKMINSTIEGCTNEVNVSNQFGMHATGGIVSWIDGNENDTSYIRNCINKGIISGGSYTGGILGGHQAGSLLIENSKNEGKIENSYGDTIGGLIGRIYVSSVRNTTIENSNNYGEIIDNNSNNVIHKVGGIIGYNVTANLTINNVNNYGNINIARRDFDDFVQINVGGIIGLNQTNNKDLITKIDNSSNQGTVTGGTYTGGLVGLNSNSNLIINKSYNKGTIDNSMLNFTVDINSRACNETGGIIGFNDQGNEYILNTYNLGEINGKDDAGGIISLSHYNSKDAIINSYNNGNITSNNRSSSIGFFNKSASSEYNILNINNIFNLGNVSSPYMRTALSIDTNITYNIKNAYSRNDTPQANVSNLMTYYDDNNFKSQSFVNILNSNLTSINLEDIDSLLEGYTLSKWKIGTNGYPILEYQQ